MRRLREASAFTGSDGMLGVLAGLRVRNAARTPRPVERDPTKLGVTINLGDVQVAISLPAPAGLADLSADHARALAMRHARRALDVAREELG